MATRSWYRIRNSYKSLLIFVLVVFGIVLVQISPGFSTPEADALVQQGQVLLNQNQPIAAIKVWRQALIQYQKSSNQIGVAGTLLNIANAHQSIQRYDLACNTLMEGLSQENQEACNPNNRKVGDNWITPALYQRPLARQLIENLGGVLPALGQLDLAQTLLTQAIAAYPQADGLKLNLALVEDWRARRAIDRYELTFSETVKINQLKVLLQASTAALQSYKELGSSPTTDPQTQLKARLNELGLLSSFAAWEARPALADWDKDRANQLAKELTTANWSTLVPYQRLEAKLLLANALSNIPGYQRQSFEITKIILQDAQTQVQPLSAAKAHHLLGKLYAQTNQLSSAIQAWQVALQDADMGLKWQTEYLIAKAFNGRNDKSDAQVHYRAAMNALQQLRGNYFGLTSSLQFSFNRVIIPFFRDYTNFLIVHQDLSGALAIIEASQSAQIESYLDCGRLNLQPVAKIAPSESTRILYLWAGTDNAYLIYRGNRNIETVSVPLSILRPKVRILTQLLQTQSFVNIPEVSLNRASQAIYQDLLAPIANKLPEKGNLVFVLDSEFQNIPMGLLHDGRQYLIERYAISNGSPLTREPKLMNPKQMRAMVGAISKSAPSFVPSQLQELPFVDMEIDAIRQSLGGGISLLENQYFTIKNFESLAQKGYPIIHLATHGDFSGDPDSTKLYAWDKPLGLNDLAEIFRASARSKPESSLELLVLSGCDLAAGDRGVELGVAGIGIQSGARTTIAGLWQIEDKATAQLMSLFYSSLAKGLPKVEALRQAQLSLKQSREYSHPYFWAPWILLGSGL